MNRPRRLLRANRRPSVSLTMIVRNEQIALPTCLGSVQGLFDEIVVVDTGSTDFTKAVARSRSFGAKVFDFPWVDDFAAARNESLRHATGDYVFWLDADDMLNPPEVDKLQALFGNLSLAELTAFACRTVSRHPGGASIDSWNIRLFPRRPGVRWSYRVHEEVITSLRRAKVPILRADVTIRHLGYHDAVTMEKKFARNHALLMRDAAERPNDPHILSVQGRFAIDRKEWDEAVCLFEQALIRTSESSDRAGLCCWIAWCHQQAGEPARAASACQVGLAQAPDSRPLLLRLGMAFREMGLPEAARKQWQRIVGLPLTAEFDPIDPGGMALMIAERMLREESPQPREEIVHGVR